MSQTIFVFGCTGQDGSLICQSLLQKRFKVIGFSRKSNPNRKNHELLGISKDFEIHQIDLKNPKEIKQAIDRFHPSEIYNLGAQSSVGKSYSKPKETIDSIVKSTTNILEVARRNKFGSKIFFAGSSEMFGHTEKAADVSHIQKPLSPYAIAKQTSFNLVKLYREAYNIKCVTGVLFNHESPLRSDDFVIQKIINAAMNISKAKLDKIHLGNVDIIRDWGWASEYVEAMQLINNAQQQKDHVICTGISTKLRDIIEKIFEKFNLNYLDHIIISQKLIRPNEINQSFGNPKQLNNHLNWKSKKNIDQIVDNLISRNIL